MTSDISVHSKKTFLNFALLFSFFFFMIMISL